ncbi:IPT/TIG domain-containing protein [Rubrivivax sp. A210]|uniref:IPT/TIG domain-containing protein n=1 Tax=Rubrivivax sp. A210 TaxID=2772301 RepID=UPI001918319B|nr:IPT/TIG domain-containing protein [Rubrivivax sp. A210]CAD5371774.1 IPT/TIG domain-containing protein [Rubrivivax sp. A210]
MPLVPALAVTPAPLSARAPRPAFRRPATALGSALLLCTLLAACGGDDDPAPVTSGAATGSAAITAALGAVANADVSVSCAATGAALGSGATGSNGAVTVSTSGTCAGPVLVTVSGRGDGSSTYYDEALAASLPFPATSSLRALAPALASPLALAVTPLTEIATRQALAAAGSLAALSAAQVNAANAAVVAQVLGAGVTLDILAPPTPWTAATAAGSLGTGAADRYAFHLAALARMGLGAAAPALAVTTALAADLADGTLAGSAAGSTGFVYTAADLATQLAAGRSAMAAFANADLQGALGVAPPAALVFSGFAPAGGAAGATVTLSGSGFDPDPFHVQVKFANNLVAEIVSSSATAVVVKVPAGAVSGPITVSNTLREQAATSSASFSVTAAAGGGTGSWVSRASPSGFLLSGLAYGAGRFVAVGFSRTLLTSTDGLSWTTATAPDSNYFEAASVTWTGSQFVMVGDKVFGSSASALIATSPDGLTWTRRSWTPDACCDVNKLVAASAGGGKITVAGAGAVASSSDGVTWSVDALPARTPADTFLREVRGLAGNSGTRVAVAVDTASNGVILVDTGSGWSYANGVSGFSPAAVTWTGSQFVAVGGSSGNFGADAVVMTSPDGLTWTRRALAAGEALSGVPLQAVLAVGSTIYATGAAGSISGSQNMIVQSTDGGASWSIAYQGTGTGQLQLVGMAASPDRVVTVGGVKSVTLP